MTSFGTMTTSTGFGSICLLIIMVDMCACSGNYGTSFLTSFLYDDISDVHSVTILNGQGLQETVQCVYAYNDTNKSLTFSRSIYEEFNNSVTTIHSGINGNTFHLTTSSDVSVFSRASNQDSSLLLPTDGFGNEYYLPFFKPVSGRCVYAVYAVNDNTVMVTSPQGNVVWNGTLYTPGKIITIFLNSRETATIMGDLGEDLTSTLVISSQPVGVNVWIERASVPTNSSPEVYGNMAEAIPPKQSWGKLFVVFPLAAGRHQGEVIRVLGYTTSNVTVTQSTGETFHLSVDSKTYAEVDTGNLSSQHLIVMSDYPVLVILYAKSGIYNNITITPFMMDVPPVEQWRNSYTLSFMSPAAAAANYINIICHEDNLAGISFSSDTDSTTVVVHTDWEMVGAPFQGKILEIRDNATYVITHADASVQFAVFMYGYSSTHSFGHPAGRNLARLYGHCSVTVASDGDGLDNDCDGKVDEEVLDGVDNDGDGSVDEDVANVIVTSSSSLEDGLSSSVGSFESETFTEITYSVSSLITSSLASDSEMTFIATTEVSTIVESSMFEGETVSISELLTSLSTLSVISIQSSSLVFSEMTVDGGTSLFSESLNMPEISSSILTTSITSSIDDSFKSLETTIIQLSTVEESLPIHTLSPAVAITASSVEVNVNYSQELSEVTQYIPTSSVIVVESGTIVIAASSVIPIVSSTGVTNSTESVKNKTSSRHDFQEKTLITVVVASLAGPIVLGGILTVLYKVITKLRAPNSHLLDKSVPEQKLKKINLKHKHTRPRKIFVQPQDHISKSVRKEVSLNKHLVITPIQVKHSIDF